MMSYAQELLLAVRLLWRDQRAGELSLLAAAIVIAVASVTTVGFFTDRVRLVLSEQSNQLLGADLTLASDRPYDSEFEAEALKRGLTITHALRFPSMVARDGENVLADVKAVAPGYPLRGELRLAERMFGPEHITRDIPVPGTAWVDERFYTQLNLHPGDTLALGKLRLSVAALITQEPDSAVGFFNSLPRVLINVADAGTSGLIQEGSRLRYRLYVAGDAAQVDAYREWATPRLKPGQNMEGIRDARPEIRNTLERAERYLGLTALLSVMLAAVAIALAAQRFLARHLDGCAVMRCLGARQMTILRLYLMHFVLLGALASALGCAVGYAAQLVLASWLGTLLAVSLPNPGAAAAWQGLAVGLSVLLAFGLPPLMSLSKVPTLRVLRRELGGGRVRGALGYGLGFAVIGALCLWKAHDVRLAVYVLGGFLAAAAGSAVVALGALKLLGLLRTAGGITWRYGLANLRRHAYAVSVQTVALALGIMALLTLSLVRGDLLQSWQAQRAPDTPNRFLINVQAEQLAPLREFFTARHLVQPDFYPMVRGRLTAINGRPVSAADYSEDRAKRLVDRETNLSWAVQAPADNSIAAGRWWGGQVSDSQQLSIEEGLATTLGLKLGDHLTYEVAGASFVATVTSLRKVEWDRFKVNFFVIAPPALLRDYPVSYITSFYAPPDAATLLGELVREFPNVVMIDVAQLMGQVQKMMDQVVQALRFVFLFTLAAGLTVLYAAIASTGDEREYEAAVMRTLGASRRQIAATHFAEFAVTGALAGLLAACGASALGYALAVKLLNVSYLADPWIWPIAIGGGAAGIAAAGMLGTRRVLRAPPLASLRRAG